MVLFLQAVIRLKPDGEYYVVNEGRRPIFIDGKPVLTDVKAKLHHNSTFEVTIHHSRQHQSHIHTFVEVSTFIL